MNEMDVRGLTWAVYLSLVFAGLYFSFWIGSWSGFMRDVFIPCIIIGAVIYLVQKAPDLGIVPEIDLEVAG